MHQLKGLANIYCRANTSNTHTHTQIHKDIHMHYVHDVLSVRRRVICPPARIDNVIKCKHCQRHQKRQRLAPLQKALYSARRWSWRPACLLNLKPGRHENNLIKFSWRKRPPTILSSENEGPDGPINIANFRKRGWLCVWLYVCDSVYVCACVCVLILLGRWVRPDNCLLKSFLAHTQTHFELLSDFRPPSLLLLLLLQF